MEEQVYHANYLHEDNYFWFISRNKIVSEVFQEICKLPEGSNLLDIGCGTGGFAARMAKSHNVTGTDTEPLALEYSRKRGLTDLHLGTLDNFQVEKKYDAAFMLDVIEHINDDSKVVSQVYNLLPSGGWFIATVPAYQWMWSKHDVIHQHYRRYTMTSFTQLLTKSGFDIEYRTYFNTLLFPLALVKRVVDKFMSKKEDTPHDEVPGPLNTLFEKLFTFESKLLPGLRLPFGLSILVIAKKK